MKNYDSGTGTTESDSISEEPAGSSGDADAPCETEGMMFSQRAVKGLGRALQWFYAARVSPLKWDSNFELASVVDSKLNLLAVAAIMCIYILYALNTVWSMVDRSVQNSFKGKDDLAFNLTWSWFFGTMAFAVCSTWWRRWDVADYINDFLRLDKRFVGKRDFSSVASKMQHRRKLLQQK